MPQCCLISYLKYFGNFRDMETIYVKILADIILAENKQIKTAKQKNKNLIFMSTFSENKTNKPRNLAFPKTFKCVQEVETP